MVVIIAVTICKVKVAEAKVAIAVMCRKEVLATNSQQQVIVHVLQERVDFLMSEMLLQE